MKEEKNNVYYDDVYKKYKHYSLDIDATKSNYHGLYKFVKDLINKEEKILEIGCGTGQFADMLIKDNFNYILGIDFSNQGIDMCKERCKKDCFLCNNIYDFCFNTIDFDVAISLEVFEHLEKDVDVINKLPKDKRLIFSVPTYDDIAHVRFFNNENEIINRFEFLFCKFNVHKLGKIFIIDAIR